MARIRSANEIILSLLDYYRTAQPELDIKIGTVARDLTVDGFATQLSRLYEELARVSAIQSLRNSLGSDLDRLGSNFNIPRRKGFKASGPALLTFNELASDIAINKNDIVTARNGATFIITNSLVISPVFANTFKSTASQFRSDLDLVGITDQYAVEISVEATTAGIQGNISKYTLSSTDISGINNITNVVPFGGGKLAEDDSSYKSRILAVFSGSNTGTSLGYKNSVLSDPAVIDAVVIVPGDTLMIRDGTQVSTAENGTKTVISEGTGGKVDVYVFGVRLQEVLDSFVYHDLSNTNDPTHSTNDFVLGQIDDDLNKTVTKKRLDDLQNGILPQQPVNNIIEISGTLSGNNFIEKVVDSLGRITGNYEIIKDYGAYGGSVWGFDKLHWISNQISDFQEDKTKGSFNGQDSLSFTDVLKISKITQNINIVNENSRILASDRSIIQLSHFPITNVTRVFNITTGERYVVSGQNIDGTGSINQTGRIKISGSSLPAVNDILQVDYTWVFSYDSNYDFDNRLTNNNPRTVQDSIDWGLSNAVKREQATLTTTGSILTVTTIHSISSVITVNLFTSEASTITLSSGRLSVVVEDSILNVVSVVRDSDSSELWNTNKADGSFSGFTIFLPTDTAGSLNNTVSVVYNAEDVFNVDGYEGSFNSNKITIVPSESAISGEIVEINYISDVNTVLPSTLLSSLPAIRNSNSFDTISSTLIGTQPTTHIFSSPGVVQRNLRIAPTKLALTISGSISPGVITVSGTSSFGLFDIIYTVGTNGLKQDLKAAIRKGLGLSSIASLPTNLKLSKLVSMDKVETTSNLEVLDTLFSFDIKGYHIKQNTFVKDEAVSDSTLNVTEIILPSTSENTENAPGVGERIKCTFYYILDGDSENVLFSKAGTLYTNKAFSIIDSISISSGFTSGSSASATLTINNLNQPITGNRYRVNYDYLAPKSNERITIRYNYNRLITDSTLNIENVRPINADVLAKESQKILVDIEMNIVVTAEFINNTTTVKQNVQDAVTSALNANSLGTIVDASDLQTVAAGVGGVDRVRVLFFNKSDEIGSVLSIIAEKNQYIAANEVIINIESR